MSKSDSFAAAIVRWPVLWGSLASMGFYALVQKGVLRGEFVHRYFASHPVEYIAMTMFFVGLAALAIKAVDLVIQRAGVDEIALGPAPDAGQPIEDADMLIERLAESSGATNQNYGVRRLREALEYVQRKGSADSLDDHLRHASDVDLDRMQSGYAFVSVIIWAIPILGFLGTVIGITMALASLDASAIDSSISAMMAGMVIAFDTTALSLALSIVLMFSKYFCDRTETSLLSSVDEKTNAELVGRFEETGTETDPQVGTMRRMAEAMVAGCERLVSRQAELWSTAIQKTQQEWQTATSTAEQRWHESFREHGEQLQSATSASQQQWLESLQLCSEQLQTAITAGLSDSVDSHAKRLAEIEKSSADQNRLHWRDVQDALSASSKAMRQQHQELTKQGEVLLQVVDATGQVRELESALNKNLQALAGEQNFEQTVMSLSAAIQLLTAHLHGNGTVGDAPQVDLHTGTSGNAA